MESHKATQLTRNNQCLRCMLQKPRNYICAAFHLCIVERIVKSIQQPMTKNAPLISKFSPHNKAVSYDQKTITISKKVPFKQTSVYQIKVSYYHPHYTQSSFGGGELRNRKRKSWRAGRFFLGRLPYNRFNIALVKHSNVLGLMFGP